ncbi:MAG: VOC family protein, partial [Candidatus Sericytochromatia bacterium]
MTTINPWINFNGNAYEAFSFYKNVFGGDFKKTVQFKDIASEAYPVSAEEGEKYLKIVLPIGNGSELIGNDVPSIMGKTNERENRSKIVVNADNKESCEK